MSYIELRGVLDDVSVEKIRYGWNSQGLGVKEVSKYMEGAILVTEFYFWDELEEGGAYRKAQTGPVLLTKLSEGMERAGLYITDMEPTDKLPLPLREDEILMLVNDIFLTGVCVFNVTKIKPAPFNPDYGSPEWANRILHVMAR